MLIYLWLLATLACVGLQPLRPSRATISSTKPFALSHSTLGSQPGAPKRQTELQQSAQARRLGHVYIMTTATNMVTTTDNQQPPNHNTTTRTAHRPKNESASLNNDTSNTQAQQHLPQPQPAQHRQFQHNATNTTTQRRNTRRPRPLRRHTGVKTNQTGDLDLDDVLQRLRQDTQATLETRKRAA